MDCAGAVRVGGISFLKTVNTLLSESTEGRTRHKGNVRLHGLVRVSERSVRVRARVRVRVSWRLAAPLGLGSGLVCCQLPSDEPLPD